jgi:hypothetical protein
MLSLERLFGEHGEDMSDVIIGAIIGLVASLVTTAVIKWLEWRHENAVRWDKDILTVATEALISAERAKGHVYAWSMGEFSRPTGQARPEQVAAAIDNCYYKMKSLAILFPSCEADIEQLQQLIVELAATTGLYRDGGIPEDKYWEQANAMRSRVSHLGDSLLDAVQRRLHVDS